MSKEKYIVFDNNYDEQLKKDYKESLAKYNKLNHEYNKLKTDYDDIKQENEILIFQNTRNLREYNESNINYGYLDEVFTNKSFDTKKYSDMKMAFSKVNIVGVFADIGCSKSNIIPISNLLQSFTSGDSAVYKISHDSKKVSLSNSRRYKSNSNNSQLKMSTGYIKIHIILNIDDVNNDLAFFKMNIISNQKMIPKIDSYFLSDDPDNIELYSIPNDYIVNFDYEKIVKDNKRDRNKLDYNNSITNNGVLNFNCDYFNDIVNVTINLKKYREFNRKIWSKLESKLLVVFPLSEFILKCEDFTFNLSVD